jgi:hypothetical protein
MTQHIVTANVREWCINDSDHDMSRRRDKGVAILTVAKGSGHTDGYLHIRTTEIDKAGREKELSVNLKPATARSLVEWFNAYQQESKPKIPAKQDPPPDGLRQQKWDLGGPRS